VIAVVPVREGVAPLGADEAVAEAGGLGLVVGSGTRDAALALPSLRAGRLAEAGPFRPGAFAAALAPLLEPEDVVVLPASPDGRDLAPRLAHHLRRPLLAGAVEVSPRAAVLARYDGRVAEHRSIAQPVVATLLPGCRGGAPRPDGAPPPDLEEVRLELPDAPDARLVALVAADPSTADLSEAERILAGGAGLGGRDAFALLERVAAALGAAAGATRVVTDAGIVPPERQIGTTGVAVSPRLYVAFGISGAVQHTAGIGTPEHVVAVNLDPSCPMMAMADLAIVADAPAVVAELAARLGVGGSGDGGSPHGTTGHGRRGVDRSGGDG
jgi:electron transfer flavoprotein alpha subunit